MKTRSILLLLFIYMGLVFPSYGQEVKVYADAGLNFSEPDQNTSIADRTGFQIGLRAVGKSPDEFLGFEAELPVMFQRFGDLKTTSVGLGLQMRIYPVRQFSLIGGIRGGVFTASRFDGESTPTESVFMNLVAGVAVPVGDKLEITAKFDHAMKSDVWQNGIRISVGYRIF